MISPRRWVPPHLPRKNGRKPRLEVGSVSPSLRLGASGSLLQDFLECRLFWDDLSWCNYENEEPEGLFGEHSSTTRPSELIASLTSSLPFLIFEARTEQELGSQVFSLSPLSNNSKRKYNPTPHGDDRIDDFPRLPSESSNHNFVSLSLFPSPPLQVFFQDGIVS